MKLKRYEHMSRDYEIAQNVLEWTPVGEDSWPTCMALPRKLG